VKKAVRHLANQLGFEILRIPPAGELVHPNAAFAPWATDADFQRTYAAIKGNTLVDIYRCHELWMLTEQVAKIAGDIIEVGVYRGGTGALIAARAALLGLDATTYHCDTFRGMVKTGAKDPFFHGGEFADTSEDTVRQLLRSLGLHNAQTVRGIFPEESGALVPSQTVRLCHIDVDVYQSAEDVLAWVWPKMPVGGIVVYDDYGFTECPGIVEHVDKQRSLRDRVVIHNLNGHAIIVKTAASS
jgi:O-methyltransferase